MNATLIIPDFAWGIANANVDSIIGAAAEADRYRPNDSDKAEGL